MSELSELYQQVILDHNKKPRNFRKIENASHTAEGYNPLCGDQLTIYLDLEDDLVKEVAFEGSGCAISKASASMMTQAVKGKSKKQAETLFQEFHSMVTGELNEETEENHLGNLKIFAGVREFPVRVKCATLAVAHAPRCSPQTATDLYGIVLATDKHGLRRSELLYSDPRSSVFTWLDFRGQVRPGRSTPDSIEPNG